MSDLAKQKILSRIANTAIVITLAISVLSIIILGSLLYAVSSKRRGAGLRALERSNAQAEARAGRAARGPGTNG